LRSPKGKFHEAPLPKIKAIACILPAMQAKGEMPGEKFQVP